jgi:hypothetical protein
VFASARRSVAKWAARPQSSRPLCGRSPRGKEEAPLLGKTHGALQTCGRFLAQSARGSFDEELTTTSVTGSPPGGRGREPVGGSASPAHPHLANEATPPAGARLLRSPRLRHACALLPAGRAEGHTAAATGGPPQSRADPARRAFRLRGGHRLPGPPSSKRTASSYRSARKLAKGLRLSRALPLGRERSSGLSGLARAV